MDDKDPGYQLNIEEELPNISQSPKIFKISLIILICASVLMITAIIILAIIYKDELNGNILSLNDKCITNYCGDDFDTIIKNI